jgi:hypothetical protein
MVHKAPLRTAPCMPILISNMCRKGQKVFLEAGSFVYYTIAMTLVGLGRA